MQIWVNGMTFGTSGCEGMMVWFATSKAVMTPKVHKNNIQIVFPT
jgi:hypothetical protein